MSDISSDLAQMANRLYILRQDLYKLTDLTQDCWDERLEFGDDRLRQAFACVQGATGKAWEAEILLHEAIRCARRARTNPTEGT